MYALIVDGKINRIMKNSIAFKHPTTGLQYPRNWITLATNSERQAAGVYEVTFSGDVKNSEYYDNTESAPVYDASKGTVTITKSASARNLASVKARKFQNARDDIYNALLPTDWYIVRKSEHNTAIPAKIVAYRLAARTVYDSLKTAITNASDVDALAAVYNYGSSARDSALSVNGTSTGVVSASNNTITSNGHGFVDDEIVTYYSGLDSSGNPYGAIGGLENYKKYYVYGKTTNTFKLSHTNSHMGDASAISLTGVASGGTTHTFTSGGVSVIGQSMPTIEIDSYNVSV